MAARLLPSSSSILKDTPRPVSELQPAMPRELARLVHRCLAKDPINRYQSAIDLRHGLEETKQDVDSGDILAEPSAGEPAGRSRMPLAIVAGALVAHGGRHLAARSRGGAASAARSADACETPCR